MGGGTFKKKKSDNWRHLTTPLDRLYSSQNGEDWKVEACVCDSALKAMWKCDFYLNRRDKGVLSLTEWMRESAWWIIYVWMNARVAFQLWPMGLFFFLCLIAILFLAVVSLGKERTVDWRETVSDSKQKSICGLSSWPKVAASLDYKEAPFKW